VLTHRPGPDWDAVNSAQQWGPSRLLVGLYNMDGSDTVLTDPPAFGDELAQRFGCRNSSTNA
jgi:hypothetical protein